MLTCRFVKLGGANSAIGAFHGIIQSRIQRTSLDVGSAQPCADKGARERAQRVGNLERELQQAGQEVPRLKAEAERLKAERDLQESELKAEVKRLKAERELQERQLKAEVERLKAERDLQESEL